MGISGNGSGNGSAWSCVTLSIFGLEFWLLDAFGPLILFKFFDKNEIFIVFTYMYMEK